MRPLEVVAFIAGEDFTDRSEYVSLILTEFRGTLNDLLPDDARQQLVHLIPLLIGTVDPKADVVYAVRTGSLRAGYQHGLT
jgi:hypothetical protein